MRCEIKGPSPIWYDYYKMPRGVRISFENAFFHIFNRGLNKQKIYIDNQDYVTFLKRLVILKKDKEFDHSIYAYVLMPNHFHLLIQTRKNSISQIMTSLLTSYSMYFNRKYERIGILFQNRFKSKLCDKETYFLGASRYILLNPIEAGLVKNLIDYPWSSYMELYNRPRVRVIDDRELEEMLNFCRMNKSEYHQFLYQGVKIVDDLKKDYAFDRDIAGTSVFNTLSQKKYLRRKSLKTV